MEGQNPYNACMSVLLGAFLIKRAPDTPVSTEITCRLICRLHQTRYPRLGSQHLRQQSFPHVQYHVTHLTGHKLHYLRFLRDLIHLAN